MTPDLQGYSGQCTLGSLAPRLLGQCSLGSPGFSPRQRSSAISGPLSATCSPISTDPTPLLYWFPMWPTLPPSLPVLT
jgi:hypothetical protein